MAKETRSGLTYRVLPLTLTALFSTRRASVLRHERARANAGYWAG